MPVLYLITMAKSFSLISSVPNPDCHSVAVICSDTVLVCHIIQINSLGVFVESYLFHENLFELMLILRFLLGNGDKLEIYAHFIRGRKRTFMSNRQDVPLRAEVFSNYGGASACYARHMRGTARSMYVTW